MIALILPVTLLALVSQQPAAGRPDAPAPAVEPSPEWKSLGPGVWLDAKSSPKKRTRSSASDRTDHRAHRAHPNRGPHGLARLVVSLVRPGLRAEWIEMPFQVDLGELQR